jgi:hypothetical protein
VPCHDGDKPGIMNLNAEDIVRGCELPPRVIGQSGVRQYDEVSFEKARVASVPETLIPKPLRSVERVQTFQNCLTF